MVKFEYGDKVTWHRGKYIFLKELDVTGIKPHAHIISQLDIYTPHAVLISQLKKGWKK